ncbi:MAG: secondary thiamine-phosphate synthase enzyme YjbQ [Thermoleophilia bacterium]
MAGLTEFLVSSTRRDEFIDITAEVQQAVTQSGAADGVCRVFVPHTTAAVTINEGADPAVVRDIIAELDAIVPHAHGYTHAEGNSAAHIKTSMLGSSQTIPVSGGRLVLGTWQAVYFCEFDGPRNRKVLVRVVPDR